MSKKLSVIVWSKQGCHYCSEVKSYLEDKNVSYQTIDITNHDDYRDILEVKYGIRHVPVVEIGNGEVYEAVTEVDLKHLQHALERVQVL
jgi:glutaredoxin 3